MNAVKPKTFRQNVLRWSPVLIGAALILAAVLIISLPPTRALAQDFLNLFRVKRFATITVDPARMQELDSREMDFEKLFAENVEVIQEAGKPVRVDSVQAASERAGYAVAVPSTLPENAKLQVSVQGEGVAVITADTSKAQALLALVGVNDVTLPAQLDGAKITVRKPAAVQLTYTFRNGEFTLMQSPSPEVELPPGVELKQLGEIGLRVLGLGANEARSFASQIDWSSTFLIPIPANAATARQVSVNGAEGLMVTSDDSNGSRPGPRTRGETVLLWANNGMVYAMHGFGSTVDLLEIANSVK